MSNPRVDDFLNFQAQTNDHPYLIDVDRAEGIYIWDKSGKRYVDMIAGVAVNNIGHRHPEIIKAIHHQTEKYLHTMVYGEYIQDPQLNLCKNLASTLPDELACSYIVNSGTEANEAALKLAKRYTGRTRIVACKNSYHGSTHGSLSVTGNSEKQASFKPLLPEVDFIEFNRIESLEIISQESACVIIETIQGDAGLVIPEKKFLKQLRERCNEVGALLIFDEVQVGMGRTGKMFAFEHFNVIPDILTLGKALGGGMPIGAFISSRKVMHSLTHAPKLGHITTFGGHPVNCAAANACLAILQQENWIAEAKKKGQLLEEILTESDHIKEIRRIGLFLAIEMESSNTAQQVVEKALKKGIILFWFLSTPQAFRISPPLSITQEEIQEAGHIILSCLQE